jgi:hypothetical protein
MSVDPFGFIQQHSVVLECEKRSVPINVITEEENPNANSFGIDTWWPFAMGVGQCRAEVV